MSKVRVESFMISVDGFGTALEQSLENPFGVGGRVLTQWAFQTKTFQTMFGKAGGSTGVDDSFASRGFDNIGACIMGRNMFGPQRGPWADESWKGWWGPNPPYHSPVFVMTHHARPTLPMEGGTVFEFVNDDVHEVLARAKAAAKGKDIRISGGVETVRAFLKAGLVDYLHLVVCPFILGAGENLIESIDLAGLGLRNVKTVPGEGALHLVYVNSRAG
ncbi:MAG: dihydrofolate reductase family protein [Alphaproteobacteria bacterium]|nr:dihydrofolate reductase family protein [Alphaproteobacteria bacterium]